MLDREKYCKIIRDSLIFSFSISRLKTHILEIEGRVITKYIFPKAPTKLKKTNVSL